MMLRNAVFAAALSVFALLAGCSDDDPPPTPPLFVGPPPPQPLSQASGLNTFAANCDGQAATGTVYLSSEVEPQIAINPTDADNWIGVWQQNRWSNGGANGLVAGVTTDGGQTWSLKTAPFSRCTGGTVGNGGNFARATDPWISFGPTGIAYWMAMSITDTAQTSRSAMLVSRSIDGGDTWEAPLPLIDNVDPYFNDKNSITADPTDALFAYAVWDRLDSSTNSGPAFFARTVDAGLSWQPAFNIRDPGFGAQTVGNLIAVLPDGTLLNLYTEIFFDSVTPDGAFLKVIRSTDQGANWSAPVTVAELLTVGTTNPENGGGVRTGGILGSIAVGPGPLDVWVTWQDSRYYFDVCLNPPCTGPGDSIVLARSADGGLTWGTPVLVPMESQVQAFTPTVHVAGDGTIGITYYDLRDDVVGDGYLLTGYWLATTADGLTFDERRISGPFDLGIAPNALGLFVGDYEGLQSAGTNFVPFFAQTIPSLSDRTNIYSVALPTMQPAKAARTYRGKTSPVAAMTPEWRAKVRDNVERTRKHFPDRTKPAFPPGYLR